MIPDRARNTFIVEAKSMLYPLTWACLPLLATGDTAKTVLVADRIQPAPPGAVRVGGFLGERIDRNIAGRLKNIPMDELLGGFQKRPGNHPWIGEHIGKWLHASMLSWGYSRDEQLKAMMDKAVADLLATQKPDGYLGTYVDQERWTSWDVWVHKYNLIGLLAYYQATGSEDALSGARRLGDLMIATFGPQKRDIIAAGTHVGMASTSILEPMVNLYRATGEEKYLAFSRYLVESWDQSNGPKVLASLLDHGKVNRTANNKAYEMMSNLVGLCELYRVTREQRYLTAAKNAWEDIARHQTYVTGGVSLNELFQPDGHQPDTGDVAETCANVTWMQLCMELLAITGEIKYVEPLERVIYNHLLAAQAQDGHDWCYFTTLVGHKLFRPEVNCCHSSGPRGLALVPGVFYGTGERRLQVRLYGESKFDGPVPGACKVELIQQTAYPNDGNILIQLRPAEPASFQLELRIPAWSRAPRVKINDENAQVEPRDGSLVIDRRWQPGDKVSLSLDVAPQWIEGTGEHAGRWAVRRGPFILCASSRWNPDFPPNWIAGVEKDIGFSDAHHVENIAAFERPLLTEVVGRVLTPSGMYEGTFVLGPYAMVQKERFAVWLVRSSAVPRMQLSLFQNAREWVSRRGNVEGAISDGDLATYRVTYDGKSAPQDIYELTLGQPVEIQTIRFHHGRVFHDGGWFDTSAGKPEIHIQTEQHGPWKPLARLESYPSTTAATAPELTNGQAFEQAVPVTRVFGVRIVGKPACGDNPAQAFSSCAELSVFGPQR